MGIADNIGYIRRNTKEAAEKYGRDPQSIALIGVTKTVSVEQVTEALKAGLRDLGENRVQEAKEKFLKLEASQGTVRPRWHLIGHLQRNKVKAAMELFSLIHSVDSLRLAREISKQAVARGRQVECLLQVNVAGEDAKYGCRFEESESLVRDIAKLPSVALEGLMTIAPFSENPEDSRPVFRKLKKLFDRIAHLKIPHVRMQYLSMGMSQDYGVAVEEGANLVRVGRAIFGERHVR